MLKFILLVCVLFVAYTESNNLGASADDFNNLFSGINKNAIVDWKGNNYNSNSIGVFTTCLNQRYSSSFSTWSSILGQVSHSNIYNELKDTSNSLSSFWYDFLTAIYQCEGTAYDVQTLYLRTCGAATFRYFRTFEMYNNNIILDGCDITYNLDNMISNYQNRNYERVGFYLAAMYKQFWRHYY